MSQAQKLAGAQQVQTQIQVSGSAYAETAQHHRARTGWSDAWGAE